MHSHFSLKVRGVPKSIFPASLCREYSRLDFVVGKVARSIIANIAIAFSGVKFFVQDNILKHRRFSQIKYTTSEDSPGSVFKLIFYSRKEDVKVLRQSGYGLRKLKSTKKASTHCFKATPLENRFYSHGGFMGLATELILDSGWRGILKRSEEDVYLKCAEILSFYGIDMDFIPEEISDPKCIEEIMLALENTPTLSAFGCIRAAESEEYKQAEKPIIEWDIWIDGGGSNSIEGSRIIHGNRRSVVLGRINALARGLLYSPRVSTDVHTGKSPLQWTEAFKKAIYMFNANIAGEAANLQSDEYKRINIEDYIGSFCLEIKSKYSTATDVSDFVSDLREKLSLKVTHIASFSQKQVSVYIAGVIPIYFRHGVWDVPKYKDESGPGEEPIVRSTMFNGSDLICINKKSGKYIINEDKLKALREFRVKHPNCSLGFYVQETDINPLAADLLIELVNRETELFSLGFAYGNISAATTNKWTVGCGGGCQAAINRIKSKKSGSSPIVA